MTRINLVHPTELCDQHLMAEWRELTRIPNGISSGKFIVKHSDIPDNYTVRTSDNPSGGKGHMKFFFNKLKFLRSRYEIILDELNKRGFKVRSMWKSDMSEFSDVYCKDYTPTSSAIELNRKRIKERMPRTPRYSLSNKK